MGMELKATGELAAAITRQASLQTYSTIQLLVDRQKVPDAFRAYAYFRWVDDCLDQKLQRGADRAAFIARQRSLIDDLCGGRVTLTACAEEQMLVHLMQAQRNGGLASYIRNMMAVMAFDAERRGRLITASELTAYTHALAVAVTEALHHFVGRRGAALPSEDRYLCVVGAHIAHMLRDTWEDNRLGYFNVPAEILEASRISPWDVRSRSYREWVRSRVACARSCFSAGRAYTARAESLRFRMACAAYVARFVGILSSIERNDYAVEQHYPKRRSLGGAFRLGWSALTSMLND